MITTSLTPAQVVERIEVAAIRAMPGAFGRKIRYALEPMAQEEIGPDLLKFDVTQKEHRDAIREAAKLADLYEKAVDINYQCNIYG